MQLIQLDWHYLKGALWGYGPLKGEALSASLQSSFLPGTGWETKIPHAVQCIQKNKSNYLCLIISTFV